MKYNKSEIMKNAWNLFHMAQKWVEKLSFSECLRRAWGKAKEAVKTAEELKKECCILIDGGRVYMRRGVIACAGLMGWVVSGNTYTARRSLKKMGFRFDGEARNWYTESADVAETLLRY